MDEVGVVEVSKKWGELVYRHLLKWEIVPAVHTTHTHTHARTHAHTHTHAHPGFTCDLQ